MNQFTLRVLDGADRGRVFEGIKPPITIGREEGNSIQLNDERVSRFHIKIQEDHEKLVLTDLESTNGTKVNGEDIQLRILRYGDMITIGRSVLLFGSREQISSRVSRIREEAASASENLEQLGLSSSGDSESGLKLQDDGDWQAKIYEFDPPSLPDRLSPGQAAQLAELLEYVHLRLRNMIGSAEADRKGQAIQLDYSQWQSLIDLQARLAEYLRRVGNPDDPLA